MGMSVPVVLTYEFDVKAAPAEVFAVLSDVPTSSSFYPKLEHLVDLGSNCYRWEMSKVGAGQVTIQTVYASQYTSNKAKGTVVWTPIKGQGNALIGGSWKIRAIPQGSNLVLDLKGDIQIPLPAFMKLAVAPIVKAEFDKLTLQYIANLTQRFGGAA